MLKHLATDAIADPYTLASREAHCAQVAEENWD